MSRLVFFDLDGTLIEGSVTATYMKELYRRKIVKTPVLLYTYLVYKLTKRFGSNKKVMHLNARVGLRALTGKSAGEIRDLIDGTWEGLLIPKIYKYSKDLVEHYFAMGDIPILLTAAPIELAQNLGQYLGFQEIRASISQVDEHNKYNGRMECLAYGQEKARIAEEVAKRFGLPMEEAIAYADSKSDIPLLLNVGVPIVVNPDKQLLKKASQCDWDILCFNIEEESLSLFSKNIKILKDLPKVFIPAFSVLSRNESIDNFFQKMINRLHNRLPLMASLFFQEETATS
jgi:HAD superfamily hydrolase (TIGR01490 family)